MGGETIAALFQYDYKKWDCLLIKDKSVHYQSG